MPTHPNSKLSLQSASRLQFPTPTGTVFEHVIDLTLPVPVDTPHASSVSTGLGGIAVCIPVIAPPVIPFPVEGLRKNVNLATPFSFISPAI